MLLLVFVCCSLIASESFAQTADSSVTPSSECEVNQSEEQQGVNSSNGRDIDKPVSSVCVTVTNPTTMQETTTTQETTTMQETTTTQETTTMEESTTIQEETTTVKEETTEKPTTVTENATETVTETDKVTTTTEQVTTIVTTSTTTPPPEPEPPFIDDGFCICDLTVLSCDINCCCDPDCSKIDREAFSHCKERPSPTLDPRYCYQSMFIYRNNTELKINRTKDGLFCIVHDNLPQRLKYEDRQRLGERKELDKLVRQKRTFKWNMNDIELPSLDVAAKYKAGQLLWKVFRDGTVVPFVLPVRLTTNFCQTSKNIQYLVEWEGSCSQFAPNEQNCEVDKLFSAESFYDDFHILMSPSRLNDSSLQVAKCTSDVCVTVNPCLCQDTLFKDCLCDSNTTSEVPQPRFSNGSCVNVVKSVKYVISHNGIEGIMKADAYILLTNITASQAAFTQEFIVTYNWEDDERSFKLSGNPGYVAGKPIMAGWKETMKDADEDKEAIMLSEDPDDWLTLLTPTNNGKCTNQGKPNRRPILFQESLRSSCSLVLNWSNFTDEGCRSLQQETLHLLIGEPKENVTSNPRYVATYGNSDVHETGDWVQILSPKYPDEVSFLVKDSQRLVCKYVTTNLHVEVVYANVGSLANPQSKIIGVAFTFGPIRDILLSCGNSCMMEKPSRNVTFELVTSVSFIDVTKPAIAAFAAPPVYEIKLPHDFFYPFMSKTNIVFPQNTMILLCICILAYRVL